MARTLTLPNNWTPRPHQLEALQALDGFVDANGVLIPGTNKKRAFLVWHRRAGKDSFAMNYTAKECVQKGKIGSYFHMLPTSKQARKVVWLGINKATGVRYIDQAFPIELRKRTLDDEMMIELKCGSIWQCVGSDNYDSLVGTNPLGMTFSEWSLSDPRAYDYMSPILVENDGWAIFIGTPRAKNFFHKQYERIKNNPRWFASLRTVEDTGLVSAEKIQEEREDGKPEERIQQEYYCSFEAQNVGAIFDKWIAALEKADKIGAQPYDPRYPVETAHDIGHRDAHAIWFIQRIGREAIAIDYHEQRGHDLKSVIKLLREKPYAYSRHIFPHDMNKFEYGAGATVGEQARQQGLHHIVAPKLSEEDGIEHTRVLLPTMRFDAVKCRRGLDALRNYHYEEEGEEEGDKMQLRAKPDHDWSSHGCKALQYYAATPVEWGTIPAWARTPGTEQGWKKEPSDWMKAQLGLQTAAATQEYDPLEAFRGSGR